MTKYPDEVYGAFKLATLLLKGNFAGTKTI
jgi:hypothetical protein